MGRKFKIIGLVLSVPIILVSSWHFYMRATWDNHMESGKPTDIYYKSSIEKHGAYLHGEELESLQEKYKTPVNIIQKGEKYVWLDKDNLVLTKSVKYRQLGKKKIKSIEFSNSDASIIVRVLGNHYLVRNHSGQFGCYGTGFGGNTSIIYTFQDGGVYGSKVLVDYYQNPLQYYLCGGFKRRFQKWKQ